ncbi:MAG: anti-sigma factor antagonist [Calditrichaeota bacterium]|nr:MAG: anti-sigma factor antagonist [Calditrichota bacterium]
MKRFKLISVHETAGVTIVSPHTKRLYMQDTDLFKAEMIELLNYVHQDIIIDFSSVNIVNSLAIGVLIASASEMRTRHKQFVIVGLNPALHEIFKRMRLDSIFDIRKDVREGMAVL